MRLTGPLPNRLLTLGLAAVLFSIAASGLGSQELPQRILIVTEEYPPYNFTGEEGEPSGAATEIVRRTLEMADRDAEIRFLPWARAYATARKRPNTLIYSLLKAPEREDLFTWIGSILPTDPGVFALADRSIPIESYDDLREYTLGTYRDDVFEQFFLARGFERYSLGGRKDAPLRSETGRWANRILFRKLLQGRIDFWPTERSIAYYTARQAGYPRPENLLQRALPIPELAGRNIYLAAHPDTDPQLIRDLSRALETLKESPEYRRILQSWDITAVPSR